jgi:hypothetical protein
VSIGKRKRRHNAGGEDDTESDSDFEDMRLGKTKGER